jgi:hypothetical protein
MKNFANDVHSPRERETEEGKKESIYTECELRES